MDWGSDGSDMMEEQGLYPLHIVWKEPTSYAHAVCFRENLLSNLVIKGVAIHRSRENHDIGQVDSAYKYHEDYMEKIMAHNEKYHLASGQPSRYLHESS